MERRRDRAANRTRTAFCAFVSSPSDPGASWVFVVHSTDPHEHSMLTWERKREHDIVYLHAPGFIENLRCSESVENISTHIPTSDTLVCSMLCGIGNHRHQMWMCKEIYQILLWNVKRHVKQTVGSGSGCTAAVAASYLRYDFVWMNNNFAHSSFAISIQKAHTLFAISELW